MCQTSRLRNRVHKRAVRPAEPSRRRLCPDARLFDGQADGLPLGIAVLEAVNHVAAFAQGGDRRERVMSRRIGTRRRRTSRRAAAGPVTVYRTTPRSGRSPPRRPGIEGTDPSRGGSPPDRSSSMPADAGSSLEDLCREPLPDDLHHRLFPDGLLAAFSAIAGDDAFDSSGLSRRL